MGTTRCRRSASEQQRLVKRWQQSSLSKAAFAKQVGISINWSRRKIVVVAAVRLGGLEATCMT